MLKHFDIMLYEVSFKSFRWKEIQNLKWSAQISFHQVPANASCFFGIFLEKKSSLQSIDWNEIKPFEVAAKYCK